MKKLKNIFIALGILFLGFSCTTEDLDPTLEQIKDISSIASVEDLSGLLKGAVDRMTSSVYYGRDFIITDEIRGDNVFANGNSGRFQTQGTLEYLPDNNPGIWTQAYAVIASANIIINADPNELEGDQSEALYIQGQAKIIRALAHFDLLRNYGQQYINGGGDAGVPVITEFAGDNLNPSRNTTSEVYTAIYNDLQTAFDQMSDQFDNRANKTLPSKYTAKALESRVAIYNGEWSRAQSAAQAVVNSDIYSVISPDSYVASFAIDNTDNSIFELAYDNVDNLGGNSLGFIYKGEVYGDIEVLPTTPDIYEEGDVRADIITTDAGGNIRNSGKYPELNGWDNVNIIRYEEVLLNLAEALFEQNDNDGAVAALNQITSMRGASEYSGTITKEDILNERRKELMFEGFRFFDLARNGLPIEKFSDLQNIVETVPAGDYRYALPIPIVEMDANSNMTQNTGY
jgi:hypothetical protein